MNRGRCRRPLRSKDVPGCKDLLEGLVGLPGFEPGTSCTPSTNPASTGSVTSGVFCGLHALGASASAHRRWPENQFRTHISAHSRTLACCAWGPLTGSSRATYSSRSEALQCCPLPSKMRSAFANTAGGTVVIWVDDGSKNVRGVAYSLEAEEKLANLVADSIRPRLIPEIEVLPWRNLNI